MSYRRIVAKFGTSLLTSGSDCLNQKRMADLVAQLAQLHAKGVELVVVTSGAIAAGREKLGLGKKVKDIPYKQVLAAVGQGRLMNAYETLFEAHGITVAQALLTKSALADRAGYLNTRNTLLALLEMGVIPIINENDVVAVDEIQEARFGDNDNLSAMVANLIDADLLLILTDIDGLYTADPHRDSSARLIPVVEKVGGQIAKLASGSTSGLGTGGMVTKIEAAGLATASGVTVVIANGGKRDVLFRIAGGEAIGTKFLPVKSRLDSRQRWMLSGLRTRGKLVVDAGAATALKKYKRSLLAAGIKQLEGNFQRGDIVAVYDPQGVKIGSGITNYSTAELESIKGAHSEDISSLLGYESGSEVIHRNNLVIL
ncbi:MAG: glutamate 5-kinase [Dehalococcoidales bacterium]|nr:glutamate 5-kinase [Dehalococcoidales bacterium]